MEDPAQIVSAIGQSFYSAPLYRRVQRWRGSALLYLGIVLALCWIPSFIKLQVTMVKALQKAQAEILPQLPEMTFANGKITTPENRPYLFYFGHGAQSVGIIIDTSGKYTSLDNQSAQILVTQSKVFIRQRTGEVRAYDLSKSKARPIVFNQQFAEKGIHLIKTLFLPILYVFIFALSYFKRLMQTFFIALLGLALVAMLEADLDLGELLSLAIVSMTPAMLVETPVAFLAKPPTHLWIFWCALMTGYFLFAINAASQPAAPPEESVS